MLLYDDIVTGSGNGSPIFIWARDTIRVTVLEMTGQQRRDNAFRYRRHKRNEVGRGSRPDSPRSPTSGVEFVQESVGALLPNGWNLEELWRKRLHDASLWHQLAAEQLRLAKLEYAYQVPLLDGRFAVWQAQRYELLALKEYCRILELYRDLLLFGRIPAL